MSIAAREAKDGSKGLYISGAEYTDDPIVPKGLILARLLLEVARLTLKSVSLATTPFKSTFSGLISQ